MPAMLDDPSAPTIYRTSGAQPYPEPGKPSVPSDIVPRQVTLRDRVTTATIVPFASKTQVPASLLAYLSDQFSKEIENGDTYPMMEGMSADTFASYWFQNFGAIILIGNIEHAEDVVEGRDWTTDCLGSFYIKPNYPGRSSHVCNAGFLVTTAARNRGVGRLMGEAYIEWAPKLGYTYSVFNLVYETNVASCRIWDALGFKRIGRVPGAGALKSYPDRFTDAIIYGRDLVSGSAEIVSEERFDKIKYYLKTGQYPAGADRAHKSRLRSAATHYKLLEDASGDPTRDKLMLKDKEVISDPNRQYEIAVQVHEVNHGGINKTTATIADKFHWVRIKETVSLVIKNCASCKETGKVPVVRGDVKDITRRSQAQNSNLSINKQPLGGTSSAAATGHVLNLANLTNTMLHPSLTLTSSTSTPLASSPFEDPFHPPPRHHHHQHHTGFLHHHSAQLHDSHAGSTIHAQQTQYIDPQIMEDVNGQSQLDAYASHHHRAPPPSQQLHTPYDETHAHSHLEYLTQHHHTDSDRTRDATPDAYLPHHHHHSPHDDDDDDDDDVANHHDPSQRTHHDDVDMSYDLSTAAAEIQHHLAQLHNHDTHTTSLAAHLSHRSGNHGSADRNLDIHHQQHDGVDDMQNGIEDNNMAEDNNANEGDADGDLDMLIDDDDDDDEQTYSPSDPPIPNHPASKHHPSSPTPSPTPTPATDIDSAIDIITLDAQNIQGPSNEVFERVGRRVRASRDGDMDDDDDDVKDESQVRAIAKAAMADEE